MSKELIEKNNECQGGIYLQNQRHFKQNGKTQ